MKTTVEKSVKNYFEWYSQSTKRLDFGRHYAGNMIIHRIHCIYCMLWLSASKMTYVWAISVEDDLFLGYQRRYLFLGHQRRRWHTFGLSASKMTYVWVINVEADLFLGYERRK